MRPWAPTGLPCASVSPCEPWGDSQSYLSGKQSSHCDGGAPGAVLSLGHSSHHSWHTRGHVLMPAATSCWAPYQAATFAFSVPFREGNSHRASFCPGGGWGGVKARASTQAWLPEGQLVVWTINPRPLEHSGASSRALKTGAHGWRGMITAWVLNLGRAHHYLTSTLPPQPAAGHPALPAASPGPSSRPAVLHTCK